MSGSSRISPTPHRSELAESDAFARRLAQTEFEQPLVLEAGAGTGKTHTLVARIVAWMLGLGWARASAHCGDDARPERIAARVVERIVALTFTEAAASEMCTRVAATLAMLADGRLPQGIERDSLPSEVAERSARARALLAQSDRLGARTLHSYSRHLLSERPLEAGLVPGFEIDADGSLQRAVVRELIESRLPVWYGEPGDEHALALARRGIAARELEGALLTLLAAGAAPRDLERDAFSPEALASLWSTGIERMECVYAAGLDRLSAARGKRTRELVSALDRLRQILEQPPPMAPALAQVAERIRELFDDSQLGRLAEWSRARFNQGESELIEHDAESLAQQCRALRSWIAHVASLDPDSFEPARALLSPLLGDATDELVARGVQTYSGLIRDAVELLEHPEIATQVRAQIDQLLVDEFQDTDALQCRMLRCLALDPRLGPRPGLFLVGDPKQSIYGWRQADLAAYEGFVSEVIAAGGAKQRLSLNFRSLPAILDEVETAIAPVMRYERGVQPGFEPLIAHRVAAEDSSQAASERESSRGCVEYWIPCEMDANDARPVQTSRERAIQLEARAVALDMCRQHAECGVAWGRMALLLRARTDQEAFLAALREHAVPFEVQGDRGYYRRREVIEAAAWVRCIVDARDSVALVAWLRSSPVGVPDSALLPLWKMGLPERLAELSRPDPVRLAALFADIRACGRAVPASAALDPVLAQAWPATLCAAVETLARLRESFETEPADHFVEKLRTLSLLEVSEGRRYLGAYRVANLDRYFRTLVRDLGAGTGDVAHVLRRLRQRVRDAEEAEESRIAESQRDAVSVLTIHQAKGLDFDHVYLAQLYKGSRRADVPSVAAIRIGDVLEYVLFRAPTPGWFHSAERALAVERAEQVRTFYVALTRARDRLVLSGVGPVGVRGGGPSAHAASYADLLATRARGLPSLDELAAQDPAAETVWDDVRWCFLARRVLASKPTSGAGPTLTSPAEQARRDLPRLRELRASAQRRSARALGAPVTQARLSEPTFADLRSGKRRGSGLSAFGARALGSIVHGLLEELDLAAEVDAIDAGLERGLRAHARADEREDVRQAVVEFWHRFQQGPLRARLRELASCVVARELPFVMPVANDLRSEDAPLYYNSGTIDLVYRDLGLGTLVVVDFKTESAHGEGEASKSEGPRSAAIRQVQAYMIALRDGLRLDPPPRGELWYLATGQIVEVS